MKGYYLAVTENTLHGSLASWGVYKVQYAGPNNLHKANYNAVLLLQITELIWEMQNRIITRSVNYFQEIQRQATEVKCMLKAQLY